MRHKVKKIRFGEGKDATEATIRKLAINFINNGRIKTTLAKAKNLKSFIDRLVFKAKEKKESTKNVLLRHLGEEKVINKLFNIVAPKFDDRSSGFVRVIKLGRRLGDGAEIGKVEWVKPVIEIKNSGRQTSSKLKIKNGKQKTKVSEEKRHGKSNNINQTAKK